MLNASVFEVGPKHTMAAMPNLWFWAALAAPITLSAVSTWLVYTFWLDKNSIRLPEDDARSRETQSQAKSRTDSPEKYTINKETNLATRLLSDILSELNGKLEECETPGSEVSLLEKADLMPQKAFSRFRKPTWTRDTDVEKGGRKRHTT